MADLKYIGKNILNHDLILKKGDVSGSLASTGSFGNLKISDNASVTGDMVVGGKLTAEEFHTEITSASIIFASGSTLFGDTQDDIHRFTGSLKITGSVTALNSTADSSSVSTRLTTEEGNVDALQADSGSFSTRVTNLKADSGSFSTRTTTLEAASASFSTRVTTAEEELELTLISGSAQLASQISGAFTDGFEFDGTISGSATSTGSFGRVEATTLVGSAFNLTNTEIEGTISSSGQIAAEISGSFRRGFEFTGTIGHARPDLHDGQNKMTASFGRIVATSLSGSAANLTNTVLDNTLSSSAQIAADISGSFTSGFEFDNSISGSATSTGSFGNVESPLNGRIIGNLTELIKVTVVSDGGNHYAFEGATAPSIQVSEGKTYRFDISDSSVGTHPFRFSTTQDGSHGGGSAYTTGVTVVGTQGQAGAYVELQVTKATANHLYYYCTAHPGMGNDGKIMKNDLTNLHMVSGSAVSTGSFGIIENNTQIAGFRPIINQTADFSASLSNAGRYHIVHGNLTCSIGTDSDMPVTVGAEYEFFQSSSLGNFL